jgi:hypothetical protein
MTVDASTSFDLETLKRGYEQWDVEALLSLYGDEVELIQIDRDNPPSSRALATARRSSGGCSSTARSLASRRR